MKRCTRCLTKETVDTITFDEFGVCSVCRQVEFKKEKIDWEDRGRQMQEMIARHPELAKFEDGQPGGLTNPLGARALYLKTNGVDYGYRIHGTPEWNSIGSNASSGCIRMINQDVMDLYNRVPDGTHVVVLTDDGQFPTRLTVPVIPTPKKPKPVEPPPAPEPLPPEPTDTGTGPF